jgi:hypothetical protein
MFVIYQILERGYRLVSPQATEMLRDINERLAAGARDVQPWYGAALFWEKLTTNWPDDLSLIKMPFFLLGRILGAGAEAIALPLSEGWQTMIPAVVGYGLGLYIVWTLWDVYSKRKLNLLVGVVGTILVGGLCLMVLQPIMIMVTGISGQLLGTVSGGTGFLASLAGAFVVGLVKHNLEKGAEARVEKILTGSSATSHDPTPKVRPSAPTLMVNTTFRLQGYQGAKAVSLTGTFNNWNQSATLFTRVGDEWLCRIDLVPGTYHYQFVVDGQWILDPSNPKTEKDGRGYVNSVLVVRAE